MAFRRRAAEAAGPAPRRAGRARLGGAVLATALLGTTLAGTAAVAAPAPPVKQAPLPAAPTQQQPTPATTVDPNLSVEALGLEVVGGFGGQALRNTWMPVTVRLTPRKLFAGDIRVSTDRGITETRTVEVAGAATKEFTFVMPSGSVHIQVQPDGQEQAVQVRPRIDGSPGGMLAGVSPAIVEDGDQGRALPDMDLPGTGERVVWVTADPLLLERTHLAVSSLGTLVVGDEDLAALTDVGLGNLVRAVGDGLNLVLVTDPGPVGDLLPWRPATGVTAAGPLGLATVSAAEQTWTLTAADLGAAFGPPVGDTAPDDTVLAASQPVGLGRVVVTGLSPAGGGLGASSEVWSQLVAERDASHRLNGQHSSERGWIAQETLRSGGVLDVPSLGLLAAFALAYVLLMGPGNALLLKRLGRRELGWITVPVITFGFIGLAAGVASGTQPSIGVTGGATTWVDGRATDLTIAAVRAPSAGTHEVTLPGPDWQLDPTTADFSGVSLTVDRSTGDVVTRIDLQSLQVGSVIAHRASDEPAPLQVSAKVADGRLRVEVTNVSTRTLTDTQIRAAGHVSGEVDLAPGASRSWDPDVSQLRQLEVYRDVFQESRGPDGQLRSPVAFRALISGEALADRPGTVVVVGEDADAPTEIHADGVRVESLGRTVAVMVPVEGEGDVTPIEVARTLLVGAFQDAWQPSPHAVEGELSAVLRFRLPGRAAGRVTRIEPDVLRGEGFIEGGRIEPFPMPDIAPEVELCANVDTQFPDGSFGNAMTCGDGADIVPACPPDAVICDSGPGFWHFEYEDGRVEDGTLDIGQPDVEFLRPQQIDQALQVYDHANASWVLVTTALANNAGGLPNDFVSPLGEVLVRAQGGLFPFDFSARGIGATLQGASA